MTEANTGPARGVLESEHFVAVYRLSCTAGAEALRRCSLEWAPLCGVRDGRKIEMLSPSALPPWPDATRHEYVNDRGPHEPVEDDRLAAWWTRLNDIVDDVRKLRVCAGRKVNS